MCMPDLHDFKPRDLVQVTVRDKVVATGTKREMREVLCRVTQAEPLMDLADREDGIRRARGLGSK